MARRSLPEINSSSMADIAFMLLIFFLVATTMDNDKGLYRTLPPYQDPTIEQPPVKVIDKNLLVIKVNKDDKLMVEKRPANIADLRSTTVEFLTKMSNDENQKKYPFYEMVDIPLINGKQKVTKAIVSVQNDRGTSYEKYIEVQNEIVAAYNIVKDQYSMKHFRKSFEELSKEEQEAIKTLIPQKISEAEPKSIGGN